ncbi:MAG: hypothetical protein Q9216_004330 [Gyalolechia sp. 2 TL-2023]
MYIRRATTLDFPTLASFSVDAFSNDELYQYSNPFATKFPEDLRGHFLRKLKQRNALPGYVVWVAVNEADVEPAANLVSTEEASSATGREEVLGYAVWYRYGRSDAAKRWQGQSWSEWLESSLIGVERQYISFFGLDRSASPAAYGNIQRGGFSPEEFSPLFERWHLQGLCVSSSDFLPLDLPSPSPIAQGMEPCAAV